MLFTTDPKTRSTIIDEIRRDHGQSVVIVDEPQTMRAVRTVPRTRWTLGHRVRAAAAT